MLAAVDGLLGPADAWLGAVWAGLLSSKIVYWDMLEAYVSGIAFAVWIMGYRLLDQVPYFHKYRFEKDRSEPVPLFQPDPNNSWVPLALYLLAIHVFHAVFPKPPLNEDPPTALRVCIELLVGFVVYDFIFFWIHLGMHKLPSLAHIHKHHVHHTQTMLTASEVQHHSGVDGALQVIVNIVVQNIVLPQFGKKHLLSKLLHNIIITYMLTEIHAGYDGYWSLHNLFPWFYGGAKRHEEHHKGGHAHFQQFFLYLDFMLETYNTSAVVLKHLERELYIVVPSITTQFSNAMIRWGSCAAVLLVSIYCCL